jgi:hypothetical protein
MQTINKTEALKRLDALQEEAVQLRKIIDAPVDVRDRIKTLQDAIDYLGEDDTDVNALIHLIKNFVSNNHIRNYQSLVVIAKALNEGWQPDWTNDNQRKYTPWFKHKAGFGLSCDAYDFWDTDASVGSRLCYKSSELAVYAATQFAICYNNYLSIK